jgi:group I intron endonuclease
MVGIYIITHNKSFKRYVGQSKNIEKRLGEHWSKLRNNTHINKPLQNAYNKYGRDAFTVSTIECSEDLLTPIEQSMLDQWKGLYNINMKANVPPSHKGIPKSPEHIKKVADSNRGRTRSTETRAKLSAVHKGKKKGPRSVEHRRNGGLSQRAKNPDWAHVEKIIELREQEDLSWSNIIKKLNLRGDVSNIILIYNKAKQEGRAICSS